MKILQINGTYKEGSTGKIVVGIVEQLNENQIENYCIYTYNHNESKKAIYCGNKVLGRINSVISHTFGNYGFEDICITNKIIKELKRIKPDIVQIHNIHSHDVNLTKLFRYLKKEKIKVVYTFHDCWAFTGYCPYFTLVGCNKYKSGCEHCPQYKQCSWLFDKSKTNFKKKKKALIGLDMTIVTPSNWLADIVKQSFLKDYPVKVIHNGIDLDVFKPRPSDFRKKYNISEDKYIVLGVAFGWGIRKGLDVFIELSKQLDEKYQIVLVGTDDKIDKELPSNIISIHRTNNQQELAQIYTAADVFFNPTREENYPTVNMESIACGTPVITFNTGGSPEILNEKTGRVIQNNTLEESVIAIKDCCENHKFKKEDCLDYTKSFDINDRFKQYVVLYETIIQSMK